jgi:kynurenine formamidase
LDRIGPRELGTALQGVREAHIYELGTEFGRDMPQGSRDSFYGFRLTQYRTPKSLAGREEPGFDFSMEVITASPHLGTHVDGLAHIQCHGLTYGGHRVQDVYGDFGWRVNGMEHSRPIIGRGVLLDVARAKGVDHLPDRYEVTPEDLDLTLTSQGTELRSGDIVLVRTGWFASYYRADPDTYFDSQPGVGPDGALWLYERGMAVLGTDTSGTEPIPMPDLERTTHGVLLVERGVHLIEIMDLEEIARDRVLEFLFAALPLRITGGTGSWLRPVALV